MALGVYTEVSLILLAAAVLGAIGLLLRQPLIIVHTVWRRIRVQVVPVRGRGRSYALCPCPSVQSSLQSRTLAPAVDCVKPTGAVVRVAALR
jgi:hypothetical protein